jgi:hypothetical protein
VLDRSWMNHSVDKEHEWNVGPSCALARWCTTSVLRHFEQITRKPGPWPAGIL